MERTIENTLILEQGIDQEGRPYININKPVDSSSSHELDLTEAIVEDLSTIVEGLIFLTKTALQHGADNGLVLEIAQGFLEAMENEDGYNGQIQLRTPNGNFRLDKDERDD